MIDPKLIRENPEQVRNAMRDRGVDVDISELARLDGQWRHVLQELEEARAEQNEASISAATAKDADHSKLKELKNRIKATEIRLAELEVTLEREMARIPNIPFPDVPVGPDESGNQVLRTVGEQPLYDFEPKDHVALGQALDIIDIERAAKVSGARFVYLKGGAALLEFALVQYVLGLATSPEIMGGLAASIGPEVSLKPFTPVIPPVMIRPDIFRRMARLSDEDKDERYYLPQDDLYLVGSAEHTLGAMHADEILDEKDLPARYLGFSTSFRREAGSYGKDTRGILRVHQFDKLEMESFTTAERSAQEQDFFVAFQEYILRELKLPYRVVLICTGDMGKPDARQIDMEVWMPSQQMYRETHTADLMTDYQARRLKTRVRRVDGTVELVHTNDATALAIGRTLIAIMENYQQANGSVTVPEVLRPYMGGRTELV